MSSQAQEFIRKTVIALWIGIEILVLATLGLWPAVQVGAVIGILVWIVYLIKDAILGIAGWFSKPHVVYFQEEHNNDPTRPDDDEHPLIVMGEQKYRRIK